MDGVPAFIFLPQLSLSQDSFVNPMSRSYQFSSRFRENFENIPSVMISELKKFSLDGRTDIWADLVGYKVPNKLDCCTDLVSYVGQ